MIESTRAAVDIGLADLQFIGTATMLLRLGPFTLLTDPNFLHRGERAHLGYGLTSKRLTDPAMTPEDLPPLDAVVLSHLHGDHWDRRARDGLDRSLPVITTEHAAARLRTRQGFGAAMGLRTWQKVAMHKGGVTLSVTSVPGIHSTNRILKAILPPVMGSVIEIDEPGGRQQRIYISGDTMLFDGLREIADRFPEIDLAVLHIGGTTLPGGMVVTMTGADAVTLLEMLQPRRALPIHYDDYGVFKSGVEDMRRAAVKADLSVHVRYLQRGELISL